MNGTGKQAPITPLKPLAVPAAVVMPIQPKISAEEPCVLPIQPPIGETPNYASRRWHAEAWERALHSLERRNETGARHRKTL